MLALKPKIYRPLITIIFIGVACVSLRAEHLPLKRYTVSDGLVNNRVHRIVRDSRGFLWFCTSGGLSRFDGHNFVNYDVDSGLPFPSINDLHETKTGEYWIATNGGGVIFFNPRLEVHGSSAGTRFTVFTVGDKAVTNRVNTLLEDRSGKIWAGTDGGVFMMDSSKGERSFRPVPFGFASQPEEAIQVWSFLEDSENTLWIGTKFGLFRRLPDGTLIHHDLQPTQGSDVVYTLIEVSPGNFWVGHRSGLFTFKTAGLRSGLGSIAKEERIVSGRIINICQSKDGSIWLNSGGGGLAQLINGTVRIFNVGFEADYLVEDGEGSIWAATTTDGAARIYRKGFAIYNENDGLPPLIRNIVETAEGDLLVASGNFQVSRLEGDRFVSVKIPIPAGIGWRASRVALRSRDGDWWFATTQGLFRFGRVSRIEQLASAKSQIYTVTDGLAGNDLTSLYEDSRGDIWIGNFAPGRESLTRWERSSNKFHRYSAQDGLPPFNAAISFREDRAGNLWIGFFGDGLARYKDGRFTTFTSADGLPRGSCREISLDHTGRLWFANSLNGLLRIDNPESEHPSIQIYTSAQGLSSNHATQVVDDLNGRIYVTGRAIDRLDPNTGQVRRYPVFDDLGISEFTLGFRDTRGQLWFGTIRSLVKFFPEHDQLARPAPVFIDGLRFGGITHSVSAIGDNRIESFDVNASENHVQIGFFGLGFGSGGSLRYQYRLDGIDGNWSSPTDTRAVTYAGLAPGSYRFFVRAIAADGTPSDIPAVVSFRILPPFWRRWWFLTISGLIVAGLLLAFARFRIARLKALRESENRYRTLAETASDAIITIDEASTIVFVNQAAERVFGYTRDQLLNTKLTRLMPEYLRHLHEAGLTRYKQTGTRHIAWVGAELPGLHKDGHEIPLEISFGELHRNGHRYFTGIARDVTERKRHEAERKQAEEELQRSREERLIELERVRQRIARDLHDDVGSSLTQISLLSEVVQLKVADDKAPVKEPLSSIARLSRELVDSMSDIVWAINPEKDMLSDVTQRMRHFASDVFSARGVDFQFRVPDSERKVRMGANFRRELFLVFKESVNNMARHSECTRADIELRIDPDGLFLKLTDNGRGFDVSKKSEGHGLRSMLSRAEGLGGVLEIDSSEGGGTSLTFRIPLSESDRTGFTGKLRPT